MWKPELVADAQDHQHHDLESDCLGLPTVAADISMNLAVGKPPRLEQMMLIRIGSFRARNLAATVA